jgi:hypothetical protein
MVVDQFLAHPVSGEGNVHKVSIAHPPKIVSAARRKLAFLSGKSNAHFIGNLHFWINSLKRARPRDVVPFHLNPEGILNHAGR